MKIAHFKPPDPSLPDVPFLLQQPLCLLQPFCMKIAHFNPPYPSLPDMPRVLEQLGAQNEHFLIRLTLNCCLSCSLFARKLHISHFLTSGASDAKLLCLLQPFCMKIAHFNPPYPSLPDVLQPFCMKIAFFNPPYPSLPDVIRRASFAGVAAVSFAAFLHENCIFQPTLPIPPKHVPRAL